MALTLLTARYRETVLLVDDLYDLLFRAVVDLVLLQTQNLVCRVAGLVAECDVKLFGGGLRLLEIFD